MKKLPGLNISTGINVSVQPVKRVNFIGTQESFNMCK